MKRLVLLAAFAAAVAPAPASAEPICDLKRCVLRGICERVRCDPPVVACVDVAVTAVCPP